MARTGSLGFKYLVGSPRSTVGALGDDGKPVEKDRKALSRDELISRLAVAKSKAGRAWGLFKIRKPKPKDTTVTQENFSWSFDLERIIDGKTIIGLASVLKRAMR